MRQTRCFILAILAPAFSIALCFGTSAFFLAESAHADEARASTGVYVTFDDSPDDGGGGKGGYIAPGREEKPSDDENGNDGSENPSDPKEEVHQPDKTRDEGDDAERETPPEPADDSAEDPAEDPADVMHEVPVSQEVTQESGENGAPPAHPNSFGGGWLGAWLRGGQRSFGETGDEPVGTALASLPAGELFDRELKRVANVVNESISQDVETSGGDAFGEFFARAGAAVAEALAAAWGWVAQSAAPLAALAVALAAALLLARRGLFLLPQKRSEKIIVLERDGSEEEFSWERLKASIEAPCSGKQGVTPLEIVEIANGIEAELKDMPKEDRTAREIASLVKARLSGIDAASGTSYSERHSWFTEQAGD